MPIIGGASTTFLMSQATRRRHRSYSLQKENKYTKMISKPVSAGYNYSDSINNFSDNNTEKESYYNVIRDSLKDYNFSDSDLQTIFYFSDAYTVEQIKKDPSEFVHYMEKYLNPDLETNISYDKLESIFEIIMTSKGYTKEEIEAINNNEAENDELEKYNPLNRYKSRNSICSPVCYEKIAEIYNKPYNNEKDDYYNSKSFDDLSFIMYNSTYKLDSRRIVHDLKTKYQYTDEQIQKLVLYSELGYIDIRDAGHKVQLDKEFNQMNHRVSMLDKKYGTENSIYALLAGIANLDDERIKEELEDSKRFKENNRVKIDKLFNENFSLKDIKEFNNQYHNNKMKNVVNSFLETYTGNIDNELIDKVAANISAYYDENEMPWYLDSDSNILKHFEESYKEQRGLPGKIAASGIAAGLSGVASAAGIATIITELGVITINHDYPQIYEQLNTLLHNLHNHQIPAFIAGTAVFSAGFMMCAAAKIKMDENKEKRL